MHVHAKGFVHGHLKLNHFYRLCDFWKEPIMKKNMKPVDKKTKYSSPSEFTKFLAPEVYLRQPYDYSIDYWSLGFLLYTYLNPKTSVLSLSDKDLYSLITEGNFNFNEPGWEDISLYAKDFIDRLVYLVPKRRITGRAVTKQPWVNPKLLEKKMLVAEKRRTNRL